MGLALDTTTSQNPQELASVLGPDGYHFPSQNHFGFWLPHGLGASNQAEQIQECLARFNRIIEAAFLKPKVFLRTGCGWSMSRLRSSSKIKSYYLNQRMIGRAE